MKQPQDPLVKQIDARVQAMLAHLALVNQAPRLDQYVSEHTRKLLRQAYLQGVADAALSLHDLAGLTKGRRPSPLISQ